MEDEPLSADRLIKLLGRIDPAINIVEVLKTVSDAIAWFEERPMPDLVFLDMQLADGTGVEILDAVTISCPVIYTSEYDEALWKLFNGHSSNYLLKPIDPGQLKQSLSRYRKVKENGGEQQGEERRLLVEEMKRIVKHEQT